MADPRDEPCPIECGMRVLGGKWTGTILWHLKDGPVRFNELTRQIRGASKTMIARRLDDMEQGGLVAREVLTCKPIAVAYSITPYGHSALDALEGVRAWYEAHGARHAAVRGARRA